MASGTDDEYSDIDMYAIVDHEADTDLPWNFIYQDKTIEFWKMDWHMAKQMALGNIETNPWAVSASLFVKNEILYTRSDSDEARFKSICEKIKRSDEINIKRIIKSFNSNYSTIEVLKLAKKNSDLLSARWAAWGLINYSVICLSFLNNVFFMKNWGKNLQEVFNLPLLPKNYSNLVKILSISSNYDEMISAGRLLLRYIRDLVLEKQKEIIIPVKDPKSIWNNYIGMKSYINKVRSACQKNDILAASYAATELQTFIAQEIARSEEKSVTDSYNFNFFKEINSVYSKLQLPDLMISISKGDLQELEKLVDIIDLHIEQFYKNQKINFFKFKEWNELKSFFNATA